MPESDRLQREIGTLDPATVTRLARAALGRGDATHVRWDCTPLGRHAGPATRGVWRIWGTASSGRESLRWSTVLKVLARPGTPDEVFGPDGVLYWEREALVYRSGILDTLPGGMWRPSCYELARQPGARMWLWLEDVRDRFDGHWRLEHYRRAAQILGRFNGAYLAGRPLPEFPWLTRPATLRGMLEAHAATHDLAVDSGTWSAPALRRAFRQPPTRMLGRLWSQRGVLLDRLEQLPLTLCHKDAWQGNLFAPSGSEERMTAIDWSYLGTGELGVDAADLFGASFVRTDFDPQSLDAAIFDGYVEGLADAGWKVDERAARFGYAAFAALKYASIAFWLPAVLDPNRHSWLEMISGLPVERYVERQAVLMPYLADIASGAAASLGIEL